MRRDFQAGAGRICLSLGFFYIPTGEISMNSFM